MHDRIDQIKTSGALPDGAEYLFDELDLLEGLTGEASQGQDVPHDGSQNTLSEGGDVEARPIHCSRGGPAEDSRIWRDATGTELRSGSIGGSWMPIRL